MVVLLTAVCVVKIEAIIIFDGVLNTFTDILLIKSKRTLFNDGAATIFYLKSVTSFSTESCFTTNAVDYQTFIHRPLLPWFRCHRRHNYLRIHAVQNDFISGANFTIWCNVALTAATAVVYAPQVHTLFLKQFKFFKPQRIARTSVIIAQ